MRAFLAIFATLVAFVGSLAVVSIFAPKESATTAVAGAGTGGGWEAARASMAELRRVASQSCTFLSADDASKQIYDDRYEGEAVEYRRLVAAAARGAEQRPSDLPAMAPELADVRMQICPALVAEAEAAKSAALAAAAPASAPPAGMDLAGLAGAHLLTGAQLDAAAFLAGWPMADGWWPQMKLIINCESGNNIFAYNGSDPNGGSYGLAQLNGRQHFDRAGEDFLYRFDPIVNLRTALWLRTVRGHFGGPGGWKICSELYGIS